MQSIMDAPHEFDSIENTSLDRGRKHATPQLFNMANAQGNMFRKNLNVLNNRQGAGVRVKAAKRPANK